MDNDTNAPYPITSRERSVEQHKALLLLMGVTNFKWLPCPECHTTYPYPVEWTAHVCGWCGLSFYTEPGPVTILHG
jgi:hypothetical protein